MTIGKWQKGSYGKGRNLNERIITNPQVIFIIKKCRIFVGCDIILIEAYRVIINPDLIGGIGLKTVFLAAVAAFIITAIFGIFTVPWLEKLKFGQTVRSDGPRSHLKKMGTPTMGGIIFIPAIALSTLIFSDISPAILMVLFAMVSFALVGFTDDYIKITQKRSLGLRANQKLLLQLLFSIILSFFARSFYPGTSILLAPGFSRGIDTGVWFIPFTIFVILGTVNSVNLTDGLDGLVSGITVVVSFFFTILMLYIGDINLAMFGAAISGGCLGFLIYNRHPAKVFMGDTGSLGLGGAIAAMAALTGTQIYLIFFGMIFIIETLSVIIQVLSFRFTGRRIFRMSPIHHHFELLGWTENEVVFAFWAFTLATGVLGLALFLSTRMQ